MPERPAGCSEEQWAEALAGVAAFVDQGWSQKAAACGWSEQELFALPSNWHRVDETGAVWMITNWLVRAGLKNLNRMISGASA